MQWFAHWQLVYVYLRFGVFWHILWKWVSHILTVIYPACSSMWHHRGTDDAIPSSEYIYLTFFILYFLLLLTSFRRKTELCLSNKAEMPMDRNHMYIQPTNPQIANWKQNKKYQSHTILPKLNKAFPTKPWTCAMQWWGYGKMGRSNVLIGWTLLFYSWDTYNRPLVYRLLWRQEGRFGSCWRLFNI